MRRLAGRPAIAALAALALLWTGPAAAQSIKQLGVFHDWSAYSAASGTGQICFVVAKPTEVTPTPDGYGQAYLYLTDRPDAQISNELNLIAGVNLSADQPATLTVDGKAFPLLVRGDSVWLKDPTQNGNLAGTMRAGSALTIDLVSDKGVKLRETFSLSGATAASKAMGDTCRG
jgi:hypothetical protein